MKMMMTCAGLALLLTGCVQYDWYKDNTTREQKDRQVLSCTADAIRAVPPSYVVTSESSQTNASDCDRNSKKCRSRPLYSTNTSYNSTDMSAGARDIVVKDCMYKMGYREIQIHR
ncbi:hypothetical protein ACW9IB_20260 [Pseudomonas sp. SDO524_S393]